MKARQCPIGRDLLGELWTLDGVAGRDRGLAAAMPVAASTTSSRAGYVR